MGKEDIDDKNYTGYDDRFSTYIWNSETKQFFGRTGLAWAQLTIFYTIFYCALAAFAGLCYYLFSHTLTPDQPKWILEESLIGTNPGLGYRPMPDREKNSESALIWFSLSDSKSKSRFWYKQLEDYVNEVNNPGGDNLLSCTYANDKKAIKEEACRVEGAFHDCNAGNQFGYSKGEPCILLKLNKIYGWEPDCFGINAERKYDATLLEQELSEQVKTNGMPTSLKKAIQDGVQRASNKERFLKTIWVSCEGESVQDKENLGPVKVYPQEGIPGFYFPYLMQNGYQSPFVFAQFKNPTRGVLLNIECKAWARNIFYDRINRIGSVHFELLIDV